MAPAVPPSRPLVIVADPLDPEALNLLAGWAQVKDLSKEPQDLPARLGEAQALIVRSRTRVDAEMLSRAPSLRVIGRAGVGVDNIDVEEATRRHIAVVNAPTAATTSVAELTVGLLVAVARDFGVHVPLLKGGSWQRAGQGLELAGRRVGFVGYGRIAREVASRLRAFRMTCCAYDPYVTHPPDETPLIPLDNLLASSDVVSLHASLTPENRHLINRERISRMKKGALLLNVARGALVDEEALLEALGSGQIGGAGLDVFETEPPVRRELLAHPRVVPLPHIGASTREAQRRAGEIVVEEIRRVFAGKKPEYGVNIPGRSP